jgi:hypothetical protein
MEFSAEGCKVGEKGSRVLPDVAMELNFHLQTLPGQDYF